MNAQNFSRRSFLGAAAAAAAAAAPLAHAASVKQEIPAQWDMEADVVVLGAGGAGLMAACQAHDRGAKVVVFNKGGSSYHTGTNLCGGLFTACGSRMQKADPKIKDDWKAFADDIIAYGEHMSLKEPVYGFTKHSGEAFDWLEDHGLAAHHLEPYAGHTNVRAHRQDSFKGRDYIDVLEKEIKARKIEVHHRMPVVKMYFDEAANRVVGVQCGRDGKFINCRAKMGIVIVVNGRSGPYCRWWFITGQGGILINKNGARFITEREGICHVTPKLAGNPDGCHYVLADQATWERTLKKIKLSALVGLPSWSEERVLAEFKKQENLWKCDTLEELSKESGVSLEGLKKQIEIWNKAVETKVDNQFGRSDQEWQIGAGPYYMIRMFPWNNLSCGGVRVTEEFQVLGWDMRPVNGFYAAGETVAGVHGAFYCGGNACGFAHTSGFMAGKYVTGFKETKEA